MTFRFPLAVVASLVAIALILAALACTRTVQVVVTVTPQPADANTPAPAQTANTLPATERPLPTATRQPTAAPRPTATRRPTATPRPTATRRPTATPRPTATRRTTATPRPRASTIETARFTVAASDAYYYTIQIGDSGFLNYEFGAVNAGNQSQPLDINFAISEPRGTLFFADRLTSFAGSIPVQKGKDYVFLFGNAFSLFAGKEVTFRYNWSSQPSHEVTPYFGDHSNSARCQQLRTDYRPSGNNLPAETLPALAISAYSGDWFSLIMPVFEILLSSSQTNASGMTEADKAGLAIALWGCGIE